MCKAWWTLTQRAYGIWWHEWGRGKPRWKTSMIFNDVIHIQAKEGGENDNAKGISTPKANDCLCVVHDVWWHAKPTLVTYKKPQPRQGTCKRCL